MNKIKKHFEEEAKEFDDIILKIIPFYKEMLEALILALPYPKTQKIRVADLGCGTGTIAKMILERYPDSILTCVDLAANMIETAKVKLARYKNIEYIVADFHKFNFNRKYDIVVTSLALHHLRDNQEKKKFFKKIFDALNKNGVFYNADVVLGSSETLQNLYMNKWKEFMQRKISQSEVENIWCPKYEDEDRPAKIIDQIKWLKEIGFKKTDIIWKYYNFAVYGGIKP
ncbi:methyltransferase domain-containing protein [candidate division WOR-3 bacterium]|nr:methyltransferase domain-containing protein [candidate division WOR-3 bacterium]